MKSGTRRVLAFGGAAAAAALGWLGCNALREPKGSDPERARIDPDELRHARDLEIGFEEPVEMFSRPTFGNHLDGERTIAIFERSALALCRFPPAEPWRCDAFDGDGEAAPVAAEPFGGSTLLKFGDRADYRSAHFAVAHEGKRFAVCKGDCIAAGHVADRVHLLLRDADSLRVRVVSTSGSIIRDDVVMPASDYADIHFQGSLMVGSTALVLARQARANPAGVRALHAIETDGEAHIASLGPEMADVTSASSCRAGDRTYAVLGAGSMRQARWYVSFRDALGPWAPWKALEDGGGWTGCSATRAWSARGYKRGIEGMDLVLCEAAAGATSIDCGTRQMHGRVCFDGQRVYELTDDRSGVRLDTFALPTIDRDEDHVSSFLLERKGSGGLDVVCAPGGPYAIIKVGRTDKLLRLFANGDAEVVGRAAYLSPFEAELR